MAVEKKRKKRPVGRPRSNVNKPVVSTRVSEANFEKICNAADAHGFSIAAETEHRIDLSFQWEPQRLDYLEIIKGQERLHELLISIGWKRIDTVDQGPIWLPPGTSAKFLSVSLDAAAVAEAMVPELPDLLARAINKVKPGVGK